MCTDLGAANHYTLAHLQSPAIWKHVEAAEVFYVGGYHLTVCPEAAEALGKEAAREGKTMVFGMGAPFIPAAFGGPLGRLLPYCDYVLGNETEAGAWAEGQKVEDRSVRGIAKALALSEKENGKTGRTVIITQGLDPTVVAVGDGKGGAEIKEFPVHAIDPKEINDTNGAGDAFAGGFLAGLVQGKPLETCVDMGMWLAALSLRELGPSYVHLLHFPMRELPDFARKIESLVFKMKNSIKIIILMTRWRTKKSESKSKAPRSILVLEAVQILPLLSSPALENCKTCPKTAKAIQFRLTTTSSDIPRPSKHISQPDLSDLFYCSLEDECQHNQ